VRMPGNPGFGAANVAGLEHVRTPVTVLLNPDVELLDDGLSSLVELAAARDALVVPRLLNADGSVRRSAHPERVCWFDTDNRRYRIDIDTPDDLQRFAAETGHALRWPTSIEPA